MIIMWSSNIYNLISNQMWHLEFSDFSNMGDFELHLCIAASESEDHCILTEDGRDFKQYKNGEYPYFLFDYAAEVVQEIGKLIEQGVDIIDIDRVVRDVKHRWGAKV